MGEYTDCFLQLFRPALRQDEGNVGNGQRERRMVLQGEMLLRGKGARGLTWPRLLLLVDQRTEVIKAREHPLLHFPLAPGFMACGILS